MIREWEGCLKYPCHSMQRHLVFIKSIFSFSTYNPCEVCVCVLEFVVSTTPKYRKLGWDLNSHKYLAQCLQISLKILMLSSKWTNLAMTFCHVRLLDLPQLWNMNKMSYLRIEIHFSIFASVVTYPNHHIVSGALIH